jgi:large subunit ribosomal protein L10
MAKNHDVKAVVVNQAKEKLEKASSFVLVDYKGINVEDVTELRSRFRAAGVEYKVYKNTLVKRATSEIGLSAIHEQLQGTVAIAFGYGDVVAPAKVLNQFIKEHPKTTISVKAGVVEGKIMDAAQMRALGDLPSKEILLSMLLGALQGSIRNLAYSLDQIRAGKEAQA